MIQPSRYEGRPLISAEKAPLILVSRSRDMHPPSAIQRFEMAPVLSLWGCGHLAGRILEKLQSAEDFWQVSFHH